MWSTSSYGTVISSFSSGSSRGRSWHNIIFNRHFRLVSAQATDQDGVHELCYPSDVFLEEWVERSHVAFFKPSVLFEYGLVICQPSRLRHLTFARFWIILVTRRRPRWMFFELGGSSTSTFDGFTIAGHMNLQSAKDQVRVKDLG